MPTPQQLDEMIDDELRPMTDAGRIAFLRRIVRRLLDNHESLGHQLQRATGFAHADDQAEDCILCARPRLDERTANVLAGVGGAN